MKEQFKTLFTLIGTIYVVHSHHDSTSDCLFIEHCKLHDRSDNDSYNA